MFRVFSLSRRTSVPFIGSRFLSTTTETTTRAEPQCVDNLTQIGTRKIFEYEHDQCM